MGNDSLVLKVCLEKKLQPNRVSFVHPFRSGTSQKRYQLLSAGLRALHCHLTGRPNVTWGWCAMPSASPSPQTVWNDFKVPVSASAPRKLQAQSVLCHYFFTLFSMHAKYFFAWELISGMQSYCPLGENSPVKKASSS